MSCDALQHCKVSCNTINRWHRIILFRLCIKYFGVLVSEQQKHMQHEHEHEQSVHKVIKSFHFFSLNYKSWGYKSV